MALSAIEEPQVTTTVDVIEIIDGGLGEIGLLPNAHQL
jgi:hypothetical protein